MFLHVSVILSTVGGCIPACIAGGIPACLAGLSRHTPRGEVEGSGQGGLQAPHPRGKLRGLALGWSPGPHPGGPAPGWVSAPRGRSGGGLLPGGCGDPPVTATAAGGTHPTRMYSCLFLNSANSVKKIRENSIAMHILNDKHYNVGCVFCNVQHLFREPVQGNILFLPIFLAISLVTST